MTIQNIVERALKEGYLTPTMETEIGRLCESVSELSLEEYMGLDRLMGALLNGEVVPMPRKKFINVMEELVLGEAISCIKKIAEQQQCELDVGDIAAYALNRLPPLYATTEEGAEYQRQRAKEDLQPLITQQVKEGIQRYLDRPTVPGRSPLEQTQRQDIFEKMTNLLKSLALD